MTFGHSELISKPQFERYIGIDYSGADDLLPPGRTNVK